MEETSVGIAASAAVASLADWVDLDGNLLLADDPFEGLELGPDNRWRLAGPARARASRRRGLTGTRSSTLVPHGRSRERPFMWISWWTTWWTTPFRGVRGAAYDGHLTGPPDAREGEAGHRELPDGRTRRVRPSGSVRPAEIVAPAPARGRRKEGTPSMDPRTAGHASRPTRTRSSSSGSATAAVGWAGRSSMTRCARWRAAACSAASGPTTWPTSASASACSRCRRWPRSSAGSSPRSRRCAGRSPCVIAAEPGRSRPRRRRRRRRRRPRRLIDAVVATAAPERVGATGPSERPTSRSASTRCRRGLRTPRLVPAGGRSDPRSAPGRLAGTQARIRRLAISPSIWRSAST